MPLTKSMQLRHAEEIGRAVAKSHYEMFLQDKFRGPQFKWENVPGLCERMARAHIPISMPHGSKIMDQLVDIAGKVAYEEANRLLENIDDQPRT